MLNSKEVYKLNNGIAIYHVFPWFVFLYEGKMYRSWRIKTALDKIERLMK